MNISSATSIEGASPGLRTLYISFSASDLFKFLSIFKVSKIYGPLLIGSILTIVKIFSSLLMILASCSSVISKPAPVMTSPFLFFTSFPKYLPTNSSLFTDIEMSPFSWSFFAITKFNLSPFDKTFLSFFESIRSFASFMGLL